MQDKFISINNDLVSSWMAQLDPSDNISEFIETNLAQEYLCPADFESGSLKTFEKHLS